MAECSPGLPQRRKPASGVFIDRGRPTIVFLTVCTKSRLAWLTTEEVHAALRAGWARADAWLVGEYVLMPDHLHLFCAPHDLDVSLNQWVTFWKRECTRNLGRAEWRWQSGHWDSRLRRQESYTEKWHYVRMNPVRKGLGANPEAWPFQGRMHELRW